MRCAATGTCRKALKTSGDCATYSGCLPRYSPSALDVYPQRLPMILDQIDALRQWADDPFGYDPDAIHWGYVGDLGRVDQGLDELLALFDGQAKGGRRPWTICPNFPRPKACCCARHRTGE